MYCVRTALRRARRAGVIRDDEAIDRLPSLVKLSVFVRLVKRLGGRVYTNGKMVSIEDGQPAIYCFYNGENEGHALFSVRPKRHVGRTVMAIVTFPKAKRR